MLVRPMRLDLSWYAFEDSWVRRLEPAGFGCNSRNAGCRLQPGWSALLPLAIRGHRTRLFENQEHILCSSWPFPEIVRNCGIVDKDNFQQVFPQQTIFNNCPKRSKKKICLKNVYMSAYCASRWGIHLDYLHRPRSCLGYLPTTATSGSAH